MGRGKYAKAEAHFKAAIETVLPFECSRYYCHLANALQLQGRYKEMEAVFEKSIDISVSPWNPASVVFECLNNYGLPLEKNGAPEKALTMFQKATELAPSSCETFLRWALCLTRLGRFEQAANVFEAAALQGASSDKETSKICPTLCAKAWAHAVVENSGTEGHTQRVAKWREMTVWAQNTVLRSHAGPEYVPLETPLFSDKEMMEQFLFGDVPSAS